MMKLSRQSGSTLEEPITPRRHVTLPYAWRTYIQRVHHETNGVATLETIALAAIVAMFFIALLNVMQSRGYDVTVSKMNTNLDCQISLWRSGGNGSCGPSDSASSINGTNGSNQLIGANEVDRLNPGQASTEGPKCEEYSLNFEKRRDAYAQLNKELQSAGGLAKDIQFFKAAEDVVDAFTPFDDNNNDYFFDIKELDPLDLDTEQFTQRLSQFLFKKNMEVADQLQKNPNMLILPGTKNRVAQSALEWDLAMVQYEQTQVEKFIKEQITQGCISSENLAEITEAIQTNFFWRFLTASFSEFTYSKALSMAQDWVEKQGAELDYVLLNHRIAIGVAAIFDLHNFSEDQYQKYLENPDLFLTILRSN